MIEEYNKLNDSFKRTLVFHVGWRAGFFSEYNNMILAMIFCMINKIKFVLYSNDATFKYQTGWNDYFLPFCESTNNPIHKYLNMRPIQLKITEIKNLKTLNWYIKINVFNLLAKLSKPFVSFDYYTQDLWYKIRSLDIDRNYCIPALGINGNLLDACNVMVKLTWNYNTQTQNAINTLISSVQLPKKYVGVHIRRGDKSKETKLLDRQKYMDKVKPLSDIRDLFISTDDYQIIDDINMEYKEYVIYTLCNKDERGYFQEKFIKQEKEMIKRAHENLFASIDLLNNAQYFIGTFTSNLGIFLGMRMPQNRVTSIDLDKWQIW